MVSQGHQQDGETVGMTIEQTILHLYRTYQIPDTPPVFPYTPHSPPGESPTAISDLPFYGMTAKNWEILGELRDVYPSIPSPPILPIASVPSSPTLSIASDSDICEISEAEYGAAVQSSGQVTAENRARSTSPEDYEEPSTPQSVGLGISFNDYEPIRRTWTIQELESSPEPEPFLSPIAAQATPEIPVEHKPKFVAFRNSRSSLNSRNPVGTVEIYQLVAVIPSQALHQRVTGVLVDNEGTTAAITRSGYSNEPPPPGLEENIYLTMKVQEIAKKLDIHFKISCYDKHLPVGTVRASHIECQLVAKALEIDGAVWDEDGDAGDSIQEKNYTIFVDKPWCESCKEFKDAVEARTNLRFTFEHMARVKLDDKYLDSVEKWEYKKTLGLRTPPSTVKNRKRTRPANFVDNPHGSDSDGYGTPTPRFAKRPRYRVSAKIRAINNEVDAESEKEWTRAEMRAVQQRSVIAKTTTTVSVSVPAADDLPDYEYYEELQRSERSESLQ